MYTWLSLTEAATPYPDGKNLYHILFESIVSLRSSSAGTLPPCHSEPQAKNLAARPFAEFILDEVEACPEQSRKGLRVTAIGNDTIFPELALPLLGKETYEQAACTRRR
jgi:hypothetical protein